MAIEKAEQYLKEGEADFSAGKLDDAIIKMKAGIIQLESEVINKLRLVNLPRTVGRVDIPHVGRVDVPREISEYLKALERGLNDANRALVLSFLGLNPYKQLAFTM